MAPTTLSPRIPQREQGARLEKGSEEVTRHQLETGSQARPNLVPALSLLPSLLSPVVATVIATVIAINHPLIRRPLLLLALPRPQARLPQWKEKVFGRLLLQTFETGSGAA